MPTVVITPESLYRRPGPHIDILGRAGFEIRYPRSPVITTEDETIDALRGADAVLAGGDPYTRLVLSKVPDLRVIARAGVGFDRVDVEAATELGIPVAITPNGNHEAVAEHAMALLLAMTRNIVGNFAEVRAGRWLKPELAPLRGKTLGIVGFGRAGRSLAARAAGFRMDLLAFDPLGNEESAATLGVRLVSFDKLLESSDFISLHAPTNPQTRGMFDERAFSRMKRGSYLVNTARGDLVVESDLVVALESGHLAGAGLDVLRQEPPPTDHRLLFMDRVIVSPHLAANDTQAIEDMARLAATNIVDLHRGVWPTDSIVNGDLRGRFQW